MRRSKADQQPSPATSQPVKALPASGSAARLARCDIDVGGVCIVAVALRVACVGPLCVVGVRAGAAGATAVADAPVS